MLQFLVHMARPLSWCRALLGAYTASDNALCQKRSGHMQLAKFAKFSVNLPNFPATKVPSIRYDVFLSLLR